MVDRIFGIDFSGAEKAGDAIWIAEGRLNGGRVRIEGCRPASQLPGSGCERSRCLPALVAFVAGQRSAVFGCDFPFSLPAGMIEETSWRVFALTLADRFPTAESFMADCRSRGGGREIRRACDRESRVPFAAYNLRIYRQTYHGIRDILAPLLRSDRKRDAGTRQRQTHACRRNSNHNGLDLDWGEKSLGNSEAV